MSKVEKIRQELMKGKEGWAIKAVEIIKSLEEEE